MKTMSDATKVHIRQAENADLQRICLLSEEINRHHHQHVPEIFVAQTDHVREEAFWLALLQGAQSTIFVAECDHAVLGFASVSWSENTAVPFLNVKRICRIGTIVVTEAKRKQGIGENLMNAAIQWGQQQDAHEVRLEVLNFNRDAMRFYARMGFQVMSTILQRAS
ncbi:MAG: GNAT family N-acetyltransferase [Burkholderiaceae bacterium]|nr:GNAT family N-acetyltransferase [Burkholderiaceae bacterium]